MNEQIKKLEKKIRFYRMLYYNGTPIISDDTFDTLIAQLENVHPDSDVLKNEVGADFLEEHFVKKRHIIRMGSLDKVNTEEGFLTWAGKFPKNAVKILQEKLDGFSIELMYKSGILVSAITRGRDGIEGEDILRNVIKMKNVCVKLPMRITCSLRGEIVLSRDTFKMHFADTMSNERNAANGIAKRLDGEGAQHLLVLYYNIHINNGFDQQLKDELHKFISKELSRSKRDTRYKELKYDSYLTFDDDNFVREMAKVTFIEEFLRLRCVTTILCKDDSEIVGHWNRYKLKREKLNHLIDGMVIKLDSILLQKQYDSNDDLNPKSQVAFKFENEAATTTLNDVKWMVGRTGIITPLAILEPVEVQGRIFRKASLCNCDEIERLQIGIGDEVIVESCGDVIPKVTEVIKQNSSCIAEFPSACPACNGAVERSGPSLRCLNVQCSEKIIRGIIYWSKSAEIDELGEKAIRQFYEEGLIKDAADLFTLKISDISNLDRLGEKSATKIIENIQKCRELDINVFIACLGIDLLGQRTVKRITKIYGTDINDILNLSVQDLERVEGISTRKAASIVLGLAKNTFFIKKLISYGIIIKSPIKGGSKGTFCITGSCGLINPGTKKRFTRKELENIIISNGGEIGSVNKELDYLIVFADPGSKVNKAKKLGISIINEVQFASTFNIRS